MIDHVGPPLDPATALLLSFGLTMLWLWIRARQNRSRS